MRAALVRWTAGCSSYGHTEVLEQRVQRLTETRADAVDHSAAELRRIERDLHDGAQARLVALSMSLGMAESLFDTDPETAQRMVAEARVDQQAALGDLRSVVRGIHPPVLADRGLAGAVEALALDMAIPVDGRRPARRPAAGAGRVGGLLRRRRVPGQHRQARAARPARLDRAEPRRRRCCGRSSATTVAAAPTRDSGTGMRGVMRRLSAFDGTMRVSSPAGGPTIVTLEVPCDLSSPRTTPSSGPA